LVIDNHRVITALQQVPASMVLSVEPLSVNAIEVAHASGQIGLRRSHQEVIVVSHLAVGVHAPMKSLCDLVDDREPFPSIRVVQENAGALIAPGCHMVEAIRKLDS